MPAHVARTRRPVGQPRFEALRFFHVLRGRGYPDLTCSLDSHCWAHSGKPQVGDPGLMTHTQVYFFEIYAQLLAFVAHASELQCSGFLSWTSGQHIRFGYVAERFWPRRKRKLGFHIFLAASHEAVLSTGIWPTRSSEGISASPMALSWMPCRRFCIIATANRSKAKA